MIVDPACAQPHAHVLSSPGCRLTLAALTNLLQYTAWKVRARSAADPLTPAGQGNLKGDALQATTRRGSHWRKHGPTYLVAASIPWSWQT